MGIFLELTRRKDLQMNNSQGNLFDTPSPSEPTDTLFDRMTAAVRGSSNPYAQKDALKAVTANKFIGRGSSQSSTNKYRLAAGNVANCGRYSSSDIVFVSAEGARRQRIEIDRKEVELAAFAGVTFITDAPVDRNRAYNVGEREVASLLVSLGYSDDGNGCWKKSFP